MNNTKQDIKQMEGGGNSVIPRPSNAPTRLISAGEKAMLAAAAADAEVRKSCPPPAKGKAPEKDGKGADPEIAGWMNVVGHGI